MNVENMTVTLQWTSPGDNLDDGKGRDLIADQIIIDHLRFDFQFSAPFGSVTPPPIRVIKNKYVCVCVYVSVCVCVWARECVIKREKGDWEEEGEPRLE